MCVYVICIMCVYLCVQWMKYLSFHYSFSPSLSYLKPLFKKTTIDFFLNSHDNVSKLLIHGQDMTHIYLCSFAGIQSYRKLLSPNCKLIISEVGILIPCLDVKCWPPFFYFLFIIEDILPAPKARRDQLINTIGNGSTNLPAFARKAISPHFKLVVQYLFSLPRRLLDHEC